MTNNGFEVNCSFKKEYILMSELIICVHIISNVNDAEILMPSRDFWFLMPSRDFHFRKKKTSPGRAETYAVRMLLVWNILACEIKRNIFT